MASEPRPTSYYEGHTPEPWAADEGGQIFSSGETVNGGDIVCLPPEGFESSMAYWPANRRLFLDAPRLLRERDEAYRLLRETIDGEYGDGTFAKWHPKLAAALEGSECEPPKPAG